MAYKCKIIDFILFFWLYAVHQLLRMDGNNKCISFDKLLNEQIAKWTNGIHNWGDKHLIVMCNKSIRDQTEVKLNRKSLETESEQLVYTIEGETHDYNVCESIKEQTELK